MTFIKHSVCVRLVLRCVVMCSAVVRASGNPAFVQDFANTRVQTTPVYDRALHAWTLDDAYVMSTSQTVLFVQVCPADGDCLLTMPRIAQGVSGCEELRVLIAEDGWTNALHQHDVCVSGSPDRVSPAIWVDRQVRMVVSNAAGALQDFDTGADPAVSTLRLRLLYVTTVADGLFDIRIRMLTVALPRFAESQAVVAVMDECSVRELVSPLPAMSTSEGGSYMTSRLVFGEHLCQWQCGHPYLKVPFHAPAYQRAEASTGACQRTPAQFVALEAAFTLVSIPRMSPSLAQTLVLWARLDEAAHATQVLMQEAIPGAMVVFTQRGPPGSGLSIEEVMRPYALAVGTSFQALQNDVFVKRSLRRLLVSSHVDVGVDVLAISPLVDGSVAEFVTALQTAIAAVDFAGIFGADANDATAVDIDIENAHQLRRLPEPRPPSSPAAPLTPVSAWQAAVTTSDPGTLSVVIVVWFAAVLSCACCGFWALNMFCPQMHFIRNFFLYKRRHTIDTKTQGANG